MSVVTKFTVTRIENNLHEGGFKNTKVYLEPRYEKTVLDKSFSEATPSGQIVMDITNPSALEQFEIGKPFFVTFEACPPEISRYHS